MSKKKSEGETNDQNYLVFARKFRPQIFDEIKGQDATVTTLKNAILQNRVSQSFLFTGTRGVGKTSTARILAKSLNCESGPTITPCGKCPSCQEITSGTSLDVIEIDGASNNSVDNIRDLRESIATSPVHGKYKIYIIDEVHMLSAGAFNALLKTLEEPPAHAKFIFATTDAHKVPATILSRCQKFQFRRIPFHEIVKKLALIAKKEKVEATESALMLIAKTGDGSLRDAESLFDQLASFSGGKITSEKVEKCLGVASFSLYLSLLSAWSKNDSLKALQIVEKALEEGLEILPFVKGLYEMVRHFLIIKVHPDPKGLIGLAPETIKDIQKETRSFTEDGLLAISTGLEKLVQMVQYSSQARFVLEAAVIKFASLSQAASIPELLKRLEKLEKKSHLRVLDTAPKNQPVDIKGSKDETSPSKKISPPSSNANIAAPKQKAAFFSLTQVESVWSKVIQDVEKQKMSIAPALTEAEPIETEEGFLVLGFPQEFTFHKESLEQPETKALIEKALEARLGAPLEIKVVLTKANNKNINPEPESEEPVSNDIPPIVESALDIFKSGRIVRHDK